MYSLIVVDDEKVVRDGFRQFINWEELGFELIKDFEDGKDAKEFLQTNRVDVVMTDIEMLQISGIELSSYIYKKCPDTKTILVSGYKDFEYAKKAIEYNVSKYLIKPAELDEIKSLFQELKEELDQERKLKEMESHYKQKYENALPLLQEQLLLNIGSGNIKNKEELKLRMAAINLPTKIVDYSCAIIHTNVIDNVNGISHHQLTESLKVFFNQEKKGVYFITSSQNAELLRILVLSSHPKDIVISKINSVISEITTSMRRNFGIQISFEYGSIYSDIMELSRYISKDNLSNADDGNYQTTGLNIQEYREFIQEYKNFVPLIIKGEKEEVTEKLNVTMKKLSTLPIQEIQRLSIDLLSMITHVLVEMGVNIFTLNNGNSTYHQILHIDDIRGIQKYCNASLYEFISYFEKSKSNISSTHHLIEKAKKYINNNYYRDLSLEEVSEHVFLNHAYFSRLFKQLTGQNFSDYLTNIRIKKSIELLKENKYKTYEISEKVGYKSSKYFSRVFKQITGYTPREYCRKYVTESSFVNEIS